MIDAPAQPIPIDRCLERISSSANKNERGKAFSAMSVKTC
jgi:hypothetical protein